MYFLLVVLFLVRFHEACDVPIVPESPHYFDKPFWEIGEYEDLTVSVGDTLVFYLLQGLHDVHVFDKEHHLDWASCNFAEEDGIQELLTVITPYNVNLNIGSTIPISQGNYTFNETTTLYFACGGGGGTHCLDGQKFEVMVVPAKSNQAPKVWYPHYKKTPNWTLLGYPDITVSKGDRLVFKYDPLSTFHDVWLMQQPCSLTGATQLADEDDGAGSGFGWIAKCPGGSYPCTVFLGCSCRPTGALGMSEEGCGLNAGDGPLLHCLSGMGFHVTITRY